MDWDRDVYGNPEKFGLKLIWEGDRYGRDYSFDMWAVWYHPDSGQFYMAQDAGCSCPSPFEKFTSLAQLTPLNTREIEEDFKYLSKKGTIWGALSPSEYRDSITRLKEAISNAVC